MSSDVVRLLKIGDFAQVKGGKRMPAGTALTAEKTRHPYLRIVDFKDGSIDKSNLQYVPDEVFPSIARYIIDSDDLYISIVGTIGLVGKVPVELSGANLTENAAKICQIDSTVINRDYLGYFLRSEMGQGAISSMTVGSTQPKLALFRIEQIEVPCPALDIQESIVGVLNALDDRITLLRETNTTLEAIAQALYKSWVVDFDRVHAKMQGRAPEGMDEATAALFPDSFEDSGLGPVPKGWSIGSMSDLCVIASGKRPTNRSDLPSDNCNIPLYGGAGLMGYTTESLFDDKKIVTGRVGTLGRVHVAYPPCWASDNVLVLSPRDENFFSFSLEWLRGIDVHALNRGSTQPLLTQKDLGAQTGLIPHRALLQKFEEISKILNDQIRLQTLQVETLTNLRDTLIPRLISGDFHTSSNEGEAA